MTRASPSVILDVLVAVHDLGLEESRVLVPQLGSLAVQWRGAAQNKRVSRRSQEGQGTRGGLRSILVGLSQQGLQAQQHRLDVVGGGPLVLQDIEADAAREVEVGVVDGRPEEHGGRRIRVVGGEVEAELEGEAGVGRLVGAVDGSPPREQVAVGGGKRGYTRRRRGHELHKLRLQPASCQCQSTMRSMRAARDSTLPLCSILAWLGGFPPGAQLVDLDTARSRVLAVLCERHDDVELTQLRGRQSRQANQRRVVRGNLEQNAFDRYC